MSAKEKITKLEMELSEAATTIQNAKSQAQADFNRMDEVAAKMLKIVKEKVAAKMLKIVKEKEQQIKTLQTELQKNRTLLERLNELILWFEQKILNADGSFPKFKWYNIGKLITIVAKLAEWLPSTIAIFKKK